MKTPRYTPDEVAAALRAAGGVHAVAAEKLGCHRTTILDYVRRHPKVRQAYDEARAVAVDKAESKLMALVEREEWPAIRFMLVTLGRDRGYSLKHTPAEKFVEAGDEDDAAAFQEAIARVYGRPAKRKDHKSIDAGSL
jgi:hypothetical protein